jgi:crotonobetainyl-CoA:carnitine CoA-transferase CaiB-like acyl-CoA transferase
MSLPDAVAHPQIAHRGFIQEAQTPHGPVHLARSAFILQHGNGGIHRPLASAGEHNAEILAELGYSAEQIERLRASEAI